MISRVAKFRIIELETSDTGLARMVDSHDAKLSHFEAAVQDMFSFMKSSLGENRKGKGKEKVVEEEVLEDEVQDDEDVDLTDTFVLRRSTSLFDALQRTIVDNWLAERVHIGRI